MTELIRYRRRGFTLIEITIALLILAVGLVGILTLFPVGFDASARAANITEATFLAQGLVEDLKREGHDGDTVQAALTATQSGTFSAYPNYEYDIDASETGVTGLRKVDVSVFWPDEDGAPGSRDSQRSVTLSTYLADY